MPLALSHCLRELRLHRVDLDPEEFCDAVWLAARGFITGEARMLPPATQPTQAPSQLPTISPPSKTDTQGKPEWLDQRKPSRPVHALGDSSSLKMRGSLLSLPVAPAIARGVEFDRALRPLRQRREVARTMELDEESTITAIAETGVWQIVMRPARGRWLDITLVVEQSATMQLWQETSLELRQLLWRACAPRSLRTFHLEWSPRRLLMHTSGGRPVPVHAPRHGSSLILVLSDAMSFGWLTADIPELLAQWASSQPTTLVQMLPQSMWKRSALRHVTLAAAYQPRAADDKWPQVTVTTLEPDLLRRYARMLNGAAAEDVAAYRGSRSQFEVVNPRSVEERAPFNPQALSEDEIKKVFQRFEEFSSTEARKLARHLASAPLVLPVMRLVQRVLIPEAAPSQLAEVFLSGILFRRQPAAACAVPPNQVEYEFLPGVRERLLDLGGLDCSFETIGLLSRYFEKRLGKGGAFTALLEDPTAVAKEWSIAASGGNDEPFARVASFLIERMGYTLDGESDSIERERLARTSSQNTPPTLTSEKRLPRGIPGEMRLTKTSLIRRYRPGVPRKVICPHCFSEFPVENMHFASWEGGHPVKGKYGWLSRLRGLPPRPPVDTRGHRLTRKLCPLCAHGLPFTAGTQASLFIGLIGANYSGKSTYLASLIHRLETQVGQDFSSALLPVDDSTALRYRNQFYRPLFQDHLTIPATALVQSPLIYDLTFDGRLWGETRNRSVTLVFYDTAGENFAQPDSVRLMARYLRVASGVIFLIDPLQLQAVQSLVPPNVILPHETIDPDLIIGHVLTEFENGSVVEGNRPVETPVAFTFSKCDVLRNAGIIREDSLWSRDARHVAQFSIEMHREISDFFSSCMEQWNPSTFYNVKARFRNYAFFGVSALGCAPDASGRVSEISPWRVEDPLLWLLAELGIIPVR